MAVYHLISINEDQLRDWRGDHDELLRNVGSAVVLACLDPTSQSVIIRDATLDSTGEGDGASISVSHIDQHEGGNFAVWAWAAGDSVCVAGLADEELETLGKLVEAVRRSRAGAGNEAADHP
ncbi:hypothetical protein [Dyella japonica]|uniref:Uncharacterized protein n=1 Tax=Dyella japonica A8 TaxID=1217721 RepID=A0A075JZ02_9GAMM|nr:hypothetical protein [Dyella japonica]AIF47326.1 hypothetical protein HY57_08600 [Dyella japonica A8]